MSEIETNNQNPSIESPLNSNRDKIFAGIRMAALLLHQAQPEKGFERSRERCISYQDEIAATFRELGYQAHVETDPDADVSFSTNRNFKPRGHAIGFIAIENKDVVVAFDASIDQSTASVKHELVRLFASNENDLPSQIKDIASELRYIYGGNWDEDMIMLGLDLNQDSRLEF